MSYLGSVVVAHFAAEDLSPAVQYEILVTHRAPLSLIVLEHGDALFWGGSTRSELHAACTVSISPD